MTGLDDLAADLDRATQRFARTIDDSRLTFSDRSRPAFDDELVVPLRERVTGLARAADRLDAVLRSQLRRVAD